MPRTTIPEHVGQAVAGLRVALGWTQRELASKAGVSQAWLSRFENGRIRELTFERVERVVTVMGARLVVGVDAPILSDRRDQRDPAHSRVTEHVAGKLRRAGWLVATEVEVGGDRSRGWIDILAWHEASGVLLVIEIKTEVHDLGGVQRTLGWYRREATAAARRLGWRPRSVLASLILLATEANDARVSANRATFATAFPVRARALMSIVEGGPSLEGTAWAFAVAMVDPRSRRQSWLRPLRIDGRRSPAPYANYADFMGQRARRHRGHPRQGRIADAARASERA